MTTKEEVLAKIEQKIYRDSNGCWVWMGALDQNGRPKAHFDERRFGGKMVTVQVHSYLYELSYGKTDVRYVDNTCGNLRCVNPNHNKPRTLETRMRNYVVNENECWVWQGNFSEQTGYGSITINGRSQGTHRVAYTLAHGNVPTGLMVLHKCNNRLCINPDHLYAGTHNENMRDMANANSVKGEKNGMSILKLEDVVEIKKLIKSREIPYRQIGERFGVSRQTIKDIALGRTWSWVEE